VTFFSILSLIHSYNKVLSSSLQPADTDHLSWSRDVIINSGLLKLLSCSLYYYIYLLQPFFLSSSCCLLTVIYWRQFDAIAATSSAVFERKKERAIERESRWTLMTCAVRIIDQQCQQKATRNLTARWLIILHFVIRLLLLSVIVSVVSVVRGSSDCYYCRAGCQLIL